MGRRTPTPHDNDAGLIAVRKNALTGNFVCLYDGEEQGLDTDDGRAPYSTVCWAHSWVLNHSNKRNALGWLGHPDEWCEPCMVLAKDLRSLEAQILDSRKPA